MTPEQWRQIAQNNIFPGESGGDYGALYGYSGREGGQFAGVDPSRMTINQLLEFQDPSGPYGQWVKSQNNGTVSTPVGAYQIVGRTLRGAVQDMGLTGNEVFSPQMQDAIGLHIYNTQGPSAWEGWRGNGESVSTRGGDNPTAVAADTRAALGLLDNGGSQMTPEQQPRGLLGMLGIQKRDEAEGGQTAQPFYQRDNFANTMGNLAVGFNSMRLNPDQNIPQMVNARRQGRQQEKMANRTIEWLASQPGGERFAELARAAGPQAALQAYMDAQQPTAPQDPFSTIGKLAADLAAGRISQEQYDQAAAGIGAPSTVIEQNLGDQLPAADAGLRSDLYENLGEEFKSYTTAGSNAAAGMSDLQALQELSALAPSGQVTGRLAEAFPGLNDVAAVRNAIIKRVAPTLRAEGSGSTSDIEYAGMLNSLGSLTNKPEANAAIISVMQAKAQFNIDRANIVRRLTIDPEYTTQQALNDLSALEQSAGIPEQVQAVIAMAQGQSTDTGGGNTGGGTLTYNPETGGFD